MDDVLPCKQWKSVQFRIVALLIFQCSVMVTTSDFESDNISSNLVAETVRSFYLDVDVGL